MKCNKFERKNEEIFTPRRRFVCFSFLLNLPLIWSFQLERCTYFLIQIERIIKWNITATRSSSLADAHAHTSNARRFVSSNIQKQIKHALDRFCIIVYQVGCVLDLLLQFINNNNNNKHDRIERKYD